MGDIFYPGICYEKLTEIEKNNPKIRFKGTKRNIPLNRIELYLKDSKIDIFLSNEK